MTGAVVAAGGVAGFGLVPLGGAGMAAAGVTGMPAGLAGAIPDAGAAGDATAADEGGAGDVAACAIC